MVVSLLEKLYNMVVFTNPFVNGKPLEKVGRKDRGLTCYAMHHDCPSANWFTFDIELDTIGYLTIIAFFFLKIIKHVETLIM